MGKTTVIVAGGRDGSNSMSTEIWDGSYDGWVEGISKYLYSKTSILEYYMILKKKLNFGTGFAKINKQLGL